MINNYYEFAEFSGPHKKLDPQFTNPQIAKNIWFRKSLILKMSHLRKIRESKKIFARNFSDQRNFANLQTNLADFTFSRFSLACCVSECSYLRNSVERKDNVETQIVIVTQILWIFECLKQLYSLFGEARKNNFFMN